MPTNNTTPTTVNIIDGSFFCYFYTFSPAVIRNNVEVQALVGFLSALKYFSERNMLNIVVWDGHAQWRYDLHPDYKKSRMLNEALLPARKNIDEVIEPALKTILKHLPVLQIQHPNAEADDVAFGVSRVFKAQGVKLQSGDWDWAQMITSGTNWVNFRAKQEFSLETFSSNKKGYLIPDHIWQAKVLEGDVSDDIPGFANIGIKRAVYLVSKYNGLSGLVQALRQGTFKESKTFDDLLRPDAADLIAKNEQLIRLSRGPALHSHDCVITQGQFSKDLLGDSLGQWNLPLNWHSWDKAFTSEAATKVNIAHSKLARLSQAWES